MRVLGIDPGLRSTGWGVVSISEGRLQHIANGAIRPKPHNSDADRLTMIYQGLTSVIADTKPDFAAIEEYKIWLQDYYRCARLIRTQQTPWQLRLLPAMMLENRQASR